jgi:Fe-S-cluster-containing dehydrogenase component
MKVFVFDASRCNGCCGCQIACKDEHCGNDWAPYAAPQQETGHFWCKVDQITHGQVPVVKLEYNVKLCNHCADAPCLAAAPDAVYRREDGLVIIDPVKAKGKKELLGVCPYDAIYYNEELDLPQKCTGCAHLLDAGELPRCADYCQTGGLRFGEEADFAAEIAGAKVLLSDGGYGPKVYYINLPGLFCAGNVWNPEPNENIEGAKVTLTSSDGSKLEQLTDDFGDFKFERLGEDTYELAIEVSGFVPVSKTVKLDKSRYIGDFSMSK